MRSPSGTCSPGSSGCAPRGAGVGRGGGDRRHEDRRQRSSDANRDFGQIAREILAEAAEIDAREDELYGDRRGDELPEPLRTREGRR